MDTPVRLLERLTRENATGEIIAASDRGEIHVFLQEGRVAWATSSAARFAFTRHLIARCGIDQEAIKEVVKECQRTRKPLGETLVEWQLATADQVRNALLAQVTDVVHELEDNDEARALFLPRKGAYSQYDRSLTFDLDEIGGSPEPRGDDGAPSAAASQPIELKAQEVALALGEHVEWVQIIAAGKIIDSHTGCGTLPDEGIHPDLLDFLAKPDNDVAVVRTGRGALVGMRLDHPETSVWCALNVEAPLGMALRLLAAQTGASFVGRHQAAWSDPAWESQEASLAGVNCMEPLRTAIAQTDELAAIMAFPADGNTAPAAVFRREIDIGKQHQAARAITLALRHTHSSILAGGGEGGGDELAAYDMTSVQIGQGDFWHFANVLTEPSPLVVWLVLERSVSAGFGWALLTTVSRQIADCVGTGQHA